MTELKFAEPLNLPEELGMMRDQIRRFVETEVVPNGDAWEEAGKIPREVFHKLGDMGMLGMRHPVKYGGTDLGPVASVIFAEELGRSTYGGVPASVVVHTDMSATHISRRGTDAQKAKYLPGAIAGKMIAAIAVTEPGAGSDVARLKTRAVRDGDQ